MTDQLNENLRTTTVNDRLTGEDLNDQREATWEAYAELSEKEKQIQASFWGQNFLLAELAAANRLLRDLLIEKGILTTEEDNKLADSIVHKDTLQQAYENTERAFYDKYQKIRFAMENPQQVEEQISKLNEAESKTEGEDND